MSNLIYKGVEYKLILIDPSIEVSGNGLTPSGALKNFPATLENNTCYVIRRTNANVAHASVTYQTTDALKNIMFLGMPKSTDKKWIQNLITDEEINAAWKEDSAEYACIKFPHYGNKGTNDATNAVINSANLEYAIGINLYCFRQDADTYHNNNYYFPAAMFSNKHNRNWVTKFNFYNCKFGVLNYDIDSDVFLAENNRESIHGSANTQWYAYYGVNYICAKTAKEVIIEDCLINHHGRGDNGGQFTEAPFETQAISIFELDNVFVKNCKINTVPGQYCGSAGVLRFGYVERNATIRNIEANQILWTNRLNPIITISPRNHIGTVHVDGLKVRLKKFGLANPIDNKIDNGAYYGGLIFGTINYYSPNTAGKYFTIKNIDADCSNGPVKLAEANFLMAYLKGDNYYAPLPPFVKNVKVIMHDKLDECFMLKTGTNPNIICISHYWYSGNEGNTGSGSNGLTYCKSGIMRVEDIYVDARLDGHVKFAGILADLDKIHAHVYCEYCELQLNELKFDKLSGSALNFKGANYLRVKNLILPEDRKEGESACINIHQNGDVNIYIDNCNNEDVFSTIMDNNTDGKYYYSNAICTNAGADGKYIQRNRNVIAQSWSVTRNGSESNASLRLANNTTANASELFVCPRPFSAFQVTPTKTGMTDITAYFAYRDFIESDEVLGKNRFRIEVDVPYVEDGQEYYTTYSSSDWEVDESTWSDPEAVARKIVMPIEVSTLKPINVRVAYAWYSNTGCVYFDPDIRLTSHE